MKLKNNEDGFILPLVLVAMALLAGSVGYLLTQGIAELQANVLNQDYELCILTGKNAMAVAQAELENDVHYVGTAGMVSDENRGSYSITVAEASENLRIVDINSQYGDFRKEIYGELEIMPDSDDTDKGKIRSFKWKMVEAK